MSNWSAAAKYVDLVFGPWGASYNAAVRAGGIMTAGYIDVNLCSGSFPNGSNPYAEPDCAKLSSDAFYSQSGNPQNALSASYNGQIVDEFGNPASASLQAAALAAVQAQLAGLGPLDLVQFDDAATPDEYYQPTKCWGDGTPTGSGYSCNVAPGGTATAPYGSVYSRSQWKSGEAALTAMMPIPVVLNGVGASAQGKETSAAVASVAASAGNAWGGECDTCFFGTSAGVANQWAWSGPLLDNNLTSVMSVVAAGRNLIVVNEDVTDTGRRARALADIMLIYDPNHVYVANAPCGGVSHIHACAEQGLTFYAPRKPYPTSPSALASNTGVYVREFGACYNRGSAIGPCAAVVNPDPTGSHAIPLLSTIYRHTLVLQGTGPCNCYGDSGAVALNGPSAPAVLSAASGYVLLP